jgi:hypothetical protein
MKNSNQPETVTYSKRSKKVASNQLSNSPFGNGATDVQSRRQTLTVLHE